MQSLFSVLQEYEVKSATFKSEHAELLQKFLDKLNPDRTAAGYKPLSPSFLSMKLSECGLKKTSDIYTFYRQCEDAKSFTKYFWWSLKAK